MNPAELELLVGNLRGELIVVTDANDSPGRLARYHALLDAFVRDWRQCYVVNGEDPCGWQDFRYLRDALQAASRPLAEAIAMRTNRVAAHQVLEGRVLRACVSSAAGDSESGQRIAPPPASRIRSSAAGQAVLKRPLIIVAAPRSGSTLLFETLAASTQLATLGGEAHALVESIAELRPGSPGVDSNRLIARQATPPVIDLIRQQILEGLIDREGNALNDRQAFRFLEKTPKNALRIRFFNRIFPDALWLHLWREPRGSISSIMEAWRAGQWRTYPRLEGFELPWSMLLPPGWQSMRGSASGRAGCISVERNQWHSSR